ncbi:uncharacterized protein LOC134216031 [Armigeres subalbatus]|uniref:uncharacterized protein LOC134216031 n=1 Tax=Armigeres subalbatus TaxID=124917 RepID=UPI002ED333FC
MPCMKMCCFYLSTRLGSVIVGILSILQVLVPVLILIALGGADRLRNEAADINDHINNFGQEEIFMIVLRYTENNSEVVFLTAVSFCAGHSLCCIFMIVGALKVQKILLIPFIMLDFIRLCILTLMHCIGMMVIKQQLHLGDLIAITIAGGFVLLLLFYLWACVVALYQIIGIVKTEKYRSLFGNDPTALARNPIDDMISKDAQSTNKFESTAYTYNTNYLNEYPTYNKYGYAN